MEWLKLVPAIAGVVAIVLGVFALATGEWQKATAFLVAALVADQMLRKR